MRNLGRSRCFVLLGALLLLMPAVSTWAQADSSASKAQSFVEAGLTATKAQQYGEAIQQFTKAYQHDPKRSDIWFNLGMAQARTPGHELRAMAWLKAYLLANPNASNASAINQQITLLQDSFESRMGKTLEELETFLPTAPISELAPEAGLLQAASASYEVQAAGREIAAGRAFLGDTWGAIRILNITNGRHWDNGHSTFDTETPALLSAPVLPATAELGKHIAPGNVPARSPATEFILETGNSADATAAVAAHWNSDSGWLALACTEYARGKSPALEQAVDGYSRAVTEELSHTAKDERRNYIVVPAVGVLSFFGRKTEAQTIAGKFSSTETSAEDDKKEVENYLSGAAQFKTCQDKKFWWSSGRMAFLTSTGVADDLVDRKFFRADDPLYDQETFSGYYAKQNAELTSSNIAERMRAVRSVSGSLANILWIYRQVHGPYAAKATWPEENFAKGQDAERRQQWTQALRYFLMALEGDPHRTETLLHLGQVSAQISGREYRAIAFLKAYLFAAPNAEGKTETEQTIAHLFQTLQGQLKQRLQELEGPAKAEKWGEGRLECRRDARAEREALAGLSDKALQTEKEKRVIPACSEGVAPRVITAMALSGDLETARKTLASYPPYEGTIGDAGIFDSSYRTYYDELLAAFANWGALKDAEALFDEQIKHSALGGGSFPLLACREYRAGNQARALDMLSNLRAAAIAGAKPEQRERLRNFLVDIARMQVLMGDSHAAQETLNEIKYADDRKSASESALSPKPRIGGDLQGDFWLARGNAYDYLFKTFPGEECWFPTIKVEQLTDLAISGFYVYAADDYGANKCMETTVQECIEKVRQLKPDNLGNTAIDEWKNLTEALVTAYVFLRNQ